MLYDLEIFLLAITLSFLFFLYVSPQNSQLFPWNWPFIKLMPTAYLKSHELYDKITQILVENKGTVLLKTSWFTKTDILVTSDPDNVQHVMNLHFSIYQRGSGFRNIFDFLGEAVFIKDLDEWREGKKFTHSFYKETHFQKSTPKIIHYSLEKGLIPVLDHISRQNGTLDLQNLFNRFMLDSTCIMATGFDLGSLRIGFPKCPLIDAMDDIADTIFRRNILPEKVWKFQRWLNIGTEKKMAKACIVFNQILEAYVNEKSKLSANNNQEDEEDTNFDVLKFYLSKKHNEKSYLAANIMTLLFAGRDTSAALLTWFFYLISKNPFVQNKILEEIKHTNSHQKRYIFSETEELNKLVYLHGALCESLRLYPTAPVIIRDPTQEDELPSGHKVGKNTKIVLCTYTMGRMREIWGEDCMEFKPERWISDKGWIKHVGSSNFLAFGAGPWACPGKDLAFTRMKAVVATILHNFDVHVLEGQIISPSGSALLTMKHGLNVTLANRWDAIM